MIERLAAGIAPADITLDADIVAAIGCLTIALLGLVFAIYQGVRRLERTEFDVHADEALALGNDVPGKNIAGWDALGRSANR